MSRLTSCRPPWIPRYGRSAWVELRVACDAPATRKEFLLIWTEAAPRDWPTTQDSRKRRKRVTRQTTAFAAERKPNVFSNGAPSQFRQSLQLMVSKSLSSLLIIVRSSFRAKHHVVVHDKVDEMSPAPPQTPLTPDPACPRAPPPHGLHDLWKTMRTRKNRRHYRQGTWHCSCLEYCFLFLQTTGSVHTLPTGAHSMQHSKMPGTCRKNISLVPEQTDESFRKQPANRKKANVF